MKTKPRSSVPKAPRMASRRSALGSSPRRNGSAPARPRLLLPEHASGPKEKTVLFRVFFPTARQVHLAGTFNEWNPERSPMKSVGPGDWEVALVLPPGRYEYRFVVDAEWMDDPLAGRFVANPFGGINAVLDVR